MHRWPWFLLLGACRDPAPAADAGPAAVGTEPAPSASVEPHHADAKPEAGALVNPLCEGMAPSLFETACEVTNAEWAATPAPEPKALAQEAKLAGGGAPNTVEFALVNKSSKPVLVPLRFDDRNPGKSLSVIAETVGAQGIYVLAPPRVSHVAADASAHLHSTRIKLLPGGRASTSLVVDFTPVERLDKRGDAGAGRALEGSFTLHIGQLLSPAEMGDPATLAISNGLRK
jgi:hypothetical protein